MRTQLTAILLCLLLAMPSLAASKYFFEKKATGGLYLWSDDDSGGGANSNWSSTASPAYTATTKPANTDTVTVTVSTTCTFDADLSGFAAGVTLVLNGTMRFITDGTVTYLKLQAHWTGTGSLYVGNSDGDRIPAPAGATPEVAQIDFAGAYNITGALTNCELWGEERTPFYWIASKTDNTHVVLENGSEASWLTAGDVIAISDSTTKGVHSPATETFTVDSYSHDGTKGTIVLNAGTPLTRSVNQNSCVDAVVVLSRNIKVFNSVTKAASSSSFSTAVILSGIARGVHFDGLYTGLYGNPQYWTLVSCSVTNTTYGLVTSASSTGGFHTLTDCAAAGGSATLIRGAVHCNVTGCIVVNTSNLSSGSYGNLAECYALNVSEGLLSPADYSTIRDSICYSPKYAFVYSAAGIILIRCSAFHSDYYGLAFNLKSAILISCTTSANDSGSASGLTGKMFDCLLGDAIELVNYNSPVAFPDSYTLESINHDQQENAFESWMLGGIVTSQTASPPTGYDIWYELAAEDTTQTYPVFRQYETTVLPGTAIEVVGQIRIADGEDLSTSGLEPQLQIIDKFADPLVDSTQSPLDYDIPADVTGATTTWQDVSVIWANQGDSSRQVIVRMIAYNDGGADTVYIDTVWAVADYQDQIASIYGKLPSKAYLTGTDNSDGDVEMDEATGNYPGSVGSVAGAVASVTNPVTAGTVSDKTGYSLASPQTFDLTGDITGSLSGSVGSVTGAVGSVASGVTVTTNSDKSGYALSGAGVTAVQSGLATSSNVSTAEANIRGADSDTLKTISDALDLTFLAGSYTAPDNAGIAAIQAKTDNLPGSPAAVGSAMTLTAAYDAAKTAAPASTALSNVVWTDARAAQLDEIASLATVLTKLNQLQGGVNGKKVVSADGLTVQAYDRDGNLLVTLVRTGSGPFTWTPTWAE